MFTDVLTGSTDGFRLPCTHELTARTGPFASRGRRSRVLRQAVIELHPVHLLRNPDVLGRRKGVEFSESPQWNPRPLAVRAPGEEPRAAGLAEHRVQVLRGGEAAGFAFHRE